MGMETGKRGYLHQGLDDVLACADGRQAEEEGAVEDGLGAESFVVPEPFAEHDEGNRRDFCRRR
jgi:hypothetical protein